MVLFLLEGGVKGHNRGFEIGRLNDLDGFRRAVFPIHAAVFPLDRERAIITDAVQHTDDGFQIDIAMTGRDEIPTAPGITETQMRTEDAGETVQIELRVLDMHMIDAVRESGDEVDGIKLLVNEVAGVEVEAEGLGGY